MDSWFRIIGREGGIRRLAGLFSRLVSGLFRFFVRMELLVFFKQYYYFYYYQIIIFINIIIAIDFIIIIIMLIIKDVVFSFQL